MAVDILGLWQGLSALELPFQVVTACALSLRLYTKAFLLRKVGLDDYAIVLAWLCSLSTYIAFRVAFKTIQNALQGGDLNIHALGACIKAAAILYVASMAFIKISLSCFFLRIFRAHPFQRATIYLSLALTTLYSMVNGIYAAITCGAVAGVIGGRDQCLQFGAYSRLSLSWSVLNAAGDVLLAVLAVNALWSARMKRSTKLVASLILTLGTVGGIASIVRLYVIAHDNGLGNMQAGINIAKWTVVEMAAGICAASLACLRPLLSQLKSSILRIRSRLTGTDTHHPTAMESRPAPSRAMTADSQRQILEWETSYNALALKEPLPTYTRTDRKESHRAKSVALPPPPKIGILPEAD